MSHGITVEMLHWLAGEEGYGMKSVPLRFGTSPTGMRAISLNVFVSIADMEFDPAFETYTTLPSGVKVSQSGTSPTTVWPSNLRSGSE